MGNQQTPVFVVHEAFSNNRHDVEFLRRAGYTVRFLQIGEQANATPSDGEVVLHLCRANLARNVMRCTPGLAKAHDIELAGWMGTRTDRIVFVRHLDLRKVDKPLRIERLTALRRELETMIRTWDFGLAAAAA